MVTTVTIMNPDPDPETLRFFVCVDGWLEQWTLEEIKRAVAGGARLEAREQ